MCGAQDGGENLLRVGSPRPIAAATHLPSDHGRTEACSVRQFVTSRSRSTRKLKSARSSTVRCAQSAASPGSRPGSSGRSSISLKVTAGDIDAARRDHTGGALVSDDERVLEDARNPPRKASARLIVLLRAAAPEQMAHAALVERREDLRYGAQP